MVDVKDIADQASLNVATVRSFGITSGAIVGEGGYFENPNLEKRPFVDVEVAVKLPGSQKTMPQRFRAPVTSRLARAFVMATGQTDTKQWVGTPFILEVGRVGRNEYLIWLPQKG